MDKAHSAPPPHMAASQHLGRFLITLAGIVITPVLLMALIFGAIFVSLERDRLENEAERFSQGRAASLDRLFIGHISTLKALATSPSLDARDYELFQRQALELTRSEGGTILLRNRAGRQLVNTSAPWGTPLPVTTFDVDQASLTSERAVISHLVLNKAAKEWVFVINLPVKKEAELYFLSILLSSGDIKNIVQDETAPPNWVWSLVDQNSRVVGRSHNPEKYIGRLGMQSVGKRVNKPTGSFVTKNLADEEVLYAYAVSQLSNWRIGVSIPKQDVEASLWRMLMVWGLLTSIIVTAAIIAVALVNNRLRSSMQQLMSVSQRLGQVEVIDPVVTGVKEFDRISEVLSAASISLRDKTLRIRENEERLRALLNNLFVYVSLLDFNGIILEVNAAPMKAAGLKREDVIGRYFWDTYWWGWSPSVKVQIEKAVRDAREGRTVRFDVDVRMAGGILHTIDFQMAPLRAADGSIVYLIASAVDITDRKATEIKLQDSLTQLEATYATAPVGLFLLDRQLRFIAVNRHQALLDERTVEEHLGKSFREVIGEDAKQLEPQLRQVIKLGKAIDKIEFNSQNHDDPQNIRTFLASLHPLISQRGDIMGVSAAMHEISDRKRAEERQVILSRELQHRVKNNLATVEAIARATARSAKTVEEFMERFSDRITSLARTHTLVTKTHHAGAEIRDIINGELKPYDEGLKHVLIEGPILRLPTETALTFGMAIHELATNAVKYGALSTSEGNIQVRWERNSDGVTVTWRESGGPPVAVPKRKGFGSQLLQKILAKQLRGSVDLSYEPSGLVVTIKMTDEALREL